MLGNNILNSSRVFSKEADCIIVVRGWGYDFRGGSSGRYREGVKGSCFNILFKYNIIRVFEGWFFFKG